MLPESVNRYFPSTSQGTSGSKITISCCLLCLSFPLPWRKDLFLPFKEGLRGLDCPLQQQTWPSLIALGLPEQQVQLSRALLDCFQHLVTAPPPSFYASFSLAGTARPFILRAAKFGFLSAVEPALCTTLQHLEWHSLPVMCIKCSTTCTTVTAAACELRNRFEVCCGMWEPLGLHTSQCQTQKDHTNTLVRTVFLLHSLKTPTCHPPFFPDLKWELNRHTRARW